LKRERERKKREGRRSWLEGPPHAVEEDGGGEEQEQNYSKAKERGR
jgi:hypothetical protein